MLKASLCPLKMLSFGAELSRFGPREAQLAHWRPKVPCLVFLLFFIRLETQLPFVTMKLGKMPMSVQNMRIKV